MDKKKRLTCFVREGKKKPDCSLFCCVYLDVTLPDNGWDKNIEHRETQRNGCTEVSHFFRIL